MKPVHVQSDGFASLSEVLRSFVFLWCRNPFKSGSHQRLYVVEHPRVLGRLVIPSLRSGAVFCTMVVPTTKISFFFVSVFTAAVPPARWCPLVTIGSNPP